MGTKNSKTLIVIAVIIFSALSFSLALPKTSLWPFAFISLIPLYWALDRAQSYKNVILYSILWKGIHALLISYWIFNATMGQFEKGFITSLFFYVVSTLIPSIILFLVITLFYQYLKKNSLFFYGFLIPSIWILIDFLYEAVPFFIPWGFIGYGTYGMENFRMVASLGGIYLISFLIIMVNGLIYFLIKQLSEDKIYLKIYNKNWSTIHNIVKKKNILITALALFVATAVPTITGFVIKNSTVSFIQDHGNFKKVQVVQGSFGLKERWVSSNFINRMTTYLNLSKKNLQDGPELIVWPETVLNSSRQVNKDLFKHLIRNLGKDKSIIAGGVRSNKDRVSYNSAFAINGLGTVSWYDKIILLPYSENVPVVDVLGKFYDAPASFAPGSISPVLDTQLGKAGLSICFEVLYNKHIRKSINEGANLLVNISNDTWFGNSAMPWLHMHSAAFRAIETRRYMIRASNSGISAIIKPTGEITAQTKLFKRTSITGKYKTIKEMTLYSRFGNWILFLALVILMTPLLQYILKKDEEIVKS